MHIAYAGTIIIGLYGSAWERVVCVSCVCVDVPKPARSQERNDSTTGPCPSDAASSKNELPRWLCESRVATNAGRAFRLSHRSVRGYRDAGMPFRSRIPTTRKARYSEIREPTRLYILLNPVVGKGTGDGCTFALFSFFLPFVIAREFFRSKESS